MRQLVRAIEPTTIRQAMAGSRLAVAVSGHGEAVYNGYPHAGDLAIKRAEYEMDLGIVDFQATSQALDAADLALAKLVLARP